MKIYIYICKYIYIYIYVYIYIYMYMSGDNTEKIWAHRFLTKAKTISTRGLVGAVSRQWVHGDALVKVWVRSPQTIFFFV